jgi:hypothetical protein
MTTFYETNKSKFDHTINIKDVYVLDTIDIIRTMGVLKSKRDSKAVVCSDSFYFDALDNDLDLATVNIWYKCLLRLYLNLISDLCKKGRNTEVST